MVGFDGKKLRQIRTEKGISQALLAEKVESSIRYIRALEVGEKNNPSAKMIYMISNVLEATMEDFLYMEKDENEEK